MHEMYVQRKENIEVPQLLKRKLFQESERMLLRLMALRCVAYVVELRQVPLRSEGGRGKENLMEY